jgi:glycerol kinase
MYFTKIFANYMDYSSAQHFGILNGGSLKGVPVTSVLGDQQAALVGQLCWKKGIKYYLIKA